MLFDTAFSAVVARVGTVAMLLGGPEPLALRALLAPGFWRK